MNIRNLRSVFIFAFIALLTLGFVDGGDKNKKKFYKVSSKEGDAYRMFINNIDMPLNNEGVIADVNLGGNAGGYLDGKVFLYSSGFFMSGYTNGNLWANAVASASRIQDYLPGTAASPNDPNAVIYVLRSKEGDFAESWTEWKDAVALGAYFYDGDGDGAYSPVDKNGNGKWDTNEDRPDLIGDETAWCVYNDGVNAALRRFSDIDPQGINIRQSVFAFSSKGVVGNMIFVRYSLENSGLLADTLKDCIFSVWADPDLGGTVNGPYDDLVGCDTLSNSGYVYNNGDDEDWGINPPCFLIDFFQGPIQYIPGVTFTDINANGVFDDGVDTPIDTAYNVQGQARGNQRFLGAKNLGLSSYVHYMQSHPTQGDPNLSTEARNYMLGFNRIGESINPCDWEYGSVLGGVDCATVNPRFLYSGDPIAQTGWINSFETDQRMMSNTGPFTLIKNKPLDIVVAYVVGRGENALNSITKAINYDETAQFIFDQNFPSPPAPSPVELTSRNGNGFIDLTFKTSKQVTYNAVDTVLDIDRRLQGFYITAYRTNSKVPSIQGVANSTKIAEYQMDNFIEDIYQLAPNGGENKIYTNVGPNFKLDSIIYADEEAGLIRVRVNSDPFTGEQLVKGHEYYFAATQYHLNHKAIVNRDSGSYGPVGDYYDPTAGAIDEYESANIRVTYGEDQYDPSYAGQFGERVSGSSDGNVKLLTVIPENLTGDNYSVEFFKNNNLQPNQNYTAFWRLKNESKNSVLLDSSLIFDFDTLSYGGKTYDGFIVKVKPVTPLIGSLTGVGRYLPANNVWYTDFRTDSSTGIYYVGTDLPQGSIVKVGGNDVARSTVIKADKLRKVQLRFGQNGKAYRYLNGFKGTPITRRNSFVYSSYVTAAETLGTAIGKFGEGFVDVPFTAWVVDDKYKEARQLAVGIIEISKALGGTPDGVWDPGTTSTIFGNEIIAIFDAPYDANGGQIEYTGGTSTVPSDILKGYINNDPNATNQQKAISLSPWFNAMYVVGLKRQYANTWFTPGDSLIIPLTTYPYTDNDKFVFKTITKGDLTFDQKKELFNKVNVYPNPLFGYNPATSYSNSSPDAPFVTFSNLPENVTIKIFTLSGTMIRTLGTSDKSSPQSTFINWDLENESGLRAASGLYLAIVSSPEYGEKILKFSIIMPQKQIGTF